MATITEHAKKLFRARATIREMLRDRHYTCTTPRTESSMEYFASYLGTVDDHYNLIIVARKNGKKKLIVFFPIDPKLGVKPIRDIVAYMETHKCKHAIIVYKESITPFAVKEIEDDISKKVNIEQFKLEALLYNVTHNDLVPKHVVLTKHERDAYLSKHNLVADKLPKIFTSDPVVQYYGLKRGQMVKIERFSPEGHAYFYYRIVV